MNVGQVLTFHYLIVDERWALAETFLELEELVVGFGVEHLKLLSITVSVNFEAKRLGVNQLTYKKKNKVCFYA